MTEGCVFRCLDCNMPTFDMRAKCCAHCGKARLQAEHLGGVFNVQHQAFICDTCWVEMPDATATMRKALKNGALDEVAPEAAALFDLTDH